MIQLLICDDHEMVRDGLTRALQSAGPFQVLATASAADEVLLLVHTKVQANVLLLDLNLGNKGLKQGIELISQLTAAAPYLPILIVSMHNEADVVQSAMSAGARGYVTKESPVSVLAQAIVHLHEGRHFIDPTLIQHLMPHGKRPPYKAWDYLLTTREREVLRMLLQGLRVSDIAAVMGISVKTVSTHKTRLMEKLNIASNAELFKLGMRVFRD